jgi:hypothetical protein
MPDGDWTDDLSRRQIRAQERFSRRPEDFQTLYQGEPVPVPFAWDTTASRAFLKALMEEQEAMTAWNAKPWAPFGENTTLKQMQAEEKQQEALRAAWDAARAKRHAAMEALADEMREEAERRA